MHICLKAFKVSLRIFSVLRPEFLPASFIILLPLHVGGFDESPSLKYGLTDFPPEPPYSGAFNLHMDIFPADLASSVSGFNFKYGFSLLC